MRAVVGVALREGLLRSVVGRGQMIDVAQHRAERFTVVGDAADRHAAEIRAVIAAHAPDQAGTLCLTLRAPVGKRNFQRGVGGFRTRIAEEDVVEARGRHRRNAAGEFDDGRVCELKGRREVEFFGLLGDCRRDLLAAVPGERAPKASKTVEQFAALRVVVEHALPARDDARLGLELAVRGEGKPDRFEGVGVRWG